MTLIDRASALIEPLQGRPWRVDENETDGGVFVFAADGRLVAEIRGLGSGFPQEAHAKFFAEAPEFMEGLIREQERVDQQLRILTSLNDSSQKARRQAEKNADILAKENARLERKLAADGLTIEKLTEERNFFKLRFEKSQEMRQQEKEWFHKRIEWLSSQLDPEGDKARILRLEDLNADLADRAQAAEMMYYEAQIELQELKAGSEGQGEQDESRSVRVKEFREASEPEEGEAGADGRGDLESSGDPF